MVGFDAKAALSEFPLTWWPLWMDLPWKRKWLHFRYHDNVVDGFDMKNENSWILVRHDNHFLLVIWHEKIFFDEADVNQDGQVRRKYVNLLLCIQDRHSVEDMLIFWFFFFWAVNNFLYDQDRRVRWKTLSFALYWEPWLTGCLFRTDKTVENTLIYWFVLRAVNTGCMFRIDKSVENVLILWACFESRVSWYNM